MTGYPSAPSGEPEAASLVFFYLFRARHRGLPGDGAGKEHRAGAEAAGPGVDPREDLPVRVSSAVLFRIDWAGTSRLYLHGCRREDGADLLCACCSWCSGWETIRQGLCADGRAKPPGAPHGLGRHRRYLPHQKGSRGEADSLCSQCRGQVCASNRATGTELIGHEIVVIHIKWMFCVWAAEVVRGVGVWFLQSGGAVLPGQGRAAHPRP